MNKKIAILIGIISLITSSLFADKAGVVRTLDDKLLKTKITYY